MKLIKLKCVVCGRIMFAYSTDLQDFGLPECMFGCMADKSNENVDDDTIVELGEYIPDNVGTFNKAAMENVVGFLENALNTLERMGVRNDNNQP